MSAYGGSSGSSQAPQGAVKPAVSSAAPASSPTVAVPQRGNTSQAIIQRTVPGLPSGELFWRLETFAGKADADKASGGYTLVGETTFLNRAAGKTWAVTLGHRRESSAGGSLVAEVGPLPAVASRGGYLLTFQEQRMEPGGFVDTHTHPGTESYYVLDGQLSLRMPDGVHLVPEGRSNTAPSDTPVRPSNDGTVAVEMFALFVRDPSRPLTTPLQLTPAPAASA